MTISIRSTSGALVLAGVTLMLTACESTKLAEPISTVPVETRSLAPNAAGAAGATSGSAPQSQVATVDLSARGAGAGAAGGALAAPSQRVVYFDFDSFVVRDDGRPTIDAYARLLAANRGKQIVVEGHTDERGGSEYNLALGQKRAEAVVKSLTLLGAAGTQIEAVSFGKERPAAQGSDDAAWAKNRRAELRDK